MRRLCEKGPQRNMKQELFEEPLVCENLRVEAVGKGGGVGGEPRTVGA